MTDQANGIRRGGKAAIGRESAPTPAEARTVRVVRHVLRQPQFYVTAPSPCPYLEGRKERKVFTHLSGARAGELNDTLTLAGFRRSQNIAYRPACEACRACVSVRVRVDSFAPSRSQRRVLSRNADLVGEDSVPAPSAEQYELFRSYVEARHGGGGMADMTVLDYAMMIEDTQVATRLVEYRQRIPVGSETDERGKLLGVALADRLIDGLSMVYSFFGPDHDRRSLGTFMILDHIRRARSLGLPYVYLGYWVPDSAKMDYKRRFEPQEHLVGEHWVPAVPL